jgi:hypothetical protein
MRPTISIKSCETLTFVVNFPAPDRQTRYLMYHVGVARQNVSRVVVDHADVLELPQGDATVDAVVSNLPFGRQLVVQDPTRWLGHAFREINGGNPARHPPLASSDHRIPQQTHPPRTDRLSPRTVSWMLMHLQSRSCRDSWMLMHLRDPAILRRPWRRTPSATAKRSVNTTLILRSWRRRRCNPLQRNADRSINEVRQYRPRIPRARARFCTLSRMPRERLIGSIEPQTAARVRQCRARTKESPHQGRSEVEEAWGGSGRGA